MSLPFEIPDIVFRLVVWNLKVSISVGWYIG